MLNLFRESETIDIMGPDERNIEVLRYSSGVDSTLGILSENGSLGREFLAYTLEDEFREKKVSAETRIPEGTYNVKLRTEGGFHNRYLNKFSILFISFISQASTFFLVSSL